MSIDTCLLGTRLPDVRFVDSKETSDPSLTFHHHRLERNVNMVVVCYSRRTDPPVIPPVTPNFLKRYSSIDISETRKKSLRIT